MSYNPLDDYWHDFYIRRIDWYKDVLKKDPNNQRAQKEIKECKEMLYKKFLIVIEDEPEQKAEPVQLELDLFK